MSWEASTCVLGLKVGDPTRKWVLMGHANHAGPNGRTSFASKATIARYAECSVRTVARHTAVLLAEGFMREGDQRYVAHLPADRRPIVYDIAMDDETRARWREEATAGANARRATSAVHGKEGGDRSAQLRRGDNLTPRDSMEGERGANTSPRRGVTGGTPRGATHDTPGVTPVTERGDTGVTQTILEPPVEPTPSSLREEGVPRANNGDQRRRATRLPPDWQPDEQLLAWARNETPDVDLRMETDNFRDFWHSKPIGKDATKLNWSLTWQVWMRREQRPINQRKAERVKRSAGYSDEETWGHRTAASAPDPTPTPTPTPVPPAVPVPAPDYTEIFGVRPAAS